ncbi:MAG: mechanosensitive ion channel [Candidatus Omnitrophica bacterium]|nr:mechanosensitive ion channel [Candidatus Omnitrophota bacterium]
MATDYLNKLLLYLPRIPVALFIILAGWLLGKAWNRFYQKISRNSKIDPLARKYIGRLIFLAMLVFSIIIALSTLGLNISPFIAGIGAGGLIIGFGVRETVADFASGLMIFMYRPFKIGDFVKIGGVEGEIVNISPVNIELRAKDNRKILVPNRSAWGQVIYNSTKDGKNTYALQLVVNYDPGDIKDIVKSVFQKHNVSYKCCLTAVSQAGLTYVVYTEIPKEKINEIEEITKELWLEMKNKNINATITLLS